MGEETGCFIQTAVCLLGRTGLISVVSFQTATSNLPVMEMYPAALNDELLCSTLLNCLQVKSSTSSLEHGMKSILDSKALCLFLGAFSLTSCYFVVRGITCKFSKMRNTCRVFVDKRFAWC